jgi:hypothetical protein
LKSTSNRMPVDGGENLPAGDLYAYVDGKLQSKPIYTSPKVNKCLNGYDTQDAQRITLQVFGPKADYHKFVPRYY